MKARPKERLKARYLDLMKARKSCLGRQTVKQNLKARLKEKYLVKYLDSKMARKKSSVKQMD